VSLENKEEYGAREEEKAPWKIHGAVYWFLDYISLRKICIKAKFAAANLKETWAFRALVMKGYHSHPYDVKRILIVIEYPN
jgi:hypothetical protein